MSLARNCINVTVFQVKVCFSTFLHIGHNGALQAEVFSVVTQFSVVVGDGGSSDL
jgi:hypothetical protein